MADVKYVKTCLSGFLLVMSALGLAEAATYLNDYETNQVALTAGFIPDTTRIIVGEPFFLTFVLSNRAAQPFQFQHVRTEIFHITATNAAGAPARNLQYHMMDGNGFSSSVNVLPGKTHSQRIFNDWCAFDQPGDYTVTCRCQFWHFTNRAYALDQPIVTRFNLTVLPSESNRLAEVIAAWGSSMETNGSREESVQALAAIPDPRTIPYLAAAVAKSPDYIAVHALARFTNEAAADALTVALQTGEDYVAQNAGNALCRMGQSDRAARRLLPDLTNADAAVRRQTARALSWTGSELAFAPLCARLESDTNFVRYAAAEAVGQLGDPRSFAVLTNCLSDSDFALRLAAVKGLRALGKPMRAAWLTPIILAGGENIRTFYDAIDLLRIFGGDQAAPGLASCLHFDDPSVRHGYNMRLVLALEFSPNGPKYYYKWHHDPNRDGTSQELADNRQILLELKAWHEQHRPD